MLRAMQQETLDSVTGNSSATLPGAAGFASLLASFTAPKTSQEPERSGAPSDLDALEPDVATLSYERALHTHARYRPAASGPAGGFEKPISVPKAAGVATRTAPPLPDQTGRCASVTFRMSKAECAQLQRRASEAGMTMSAYLRSCTFEAEALRAQVKQALAELKAAQTQPTHRRHFRWLRFTRRGLAAES